jgi:hypothetical protein
MSEWSEWSGENVESGKRELSERLMQIVTRTRPRVVAESPESAVSGPYESGIRSQIEQTGRY